jgi:hypothetical protein
MISEEQLKKIAVGKLFVVKGYVDSDGVTADKHFKKLEEGGYQRLVKESVTQLLTRGVVNNEGYDTVTWGQAIDELVTTFTKTLKGESGRSYESKETLKPGPVADTAIHPDHGGLVISHLVKVVEDTNVNSVEEKAARNSKPLTLAKQYIRSQLPIGKYVGRINLYPGKFNSIEV